MGTIVVAVNLPITIVWSAHCKTYINDGDIASRSDEIYLKVRNNHRPNGHIGVYLYANVSRMRNKYNVRISIGNWAIIENLGIRVRAKAS